MNVRALKQVRQQRRRLRTRKRVFGTTERPRLAVHRSHLHISAQIIDDVTGKTLVSAASNAKDLREQVKQGSNCKAAALIGQVIAERARMQGIKEVCFDRAGRKFHGRVKALAEAARKTGLSF